MSGGWALPGRPAWAKLAWVPLAAAMVVDGMLIGQRGVPLVSSALVACALATLFVCHPASLLMVIAVVNAFINAFSNSIAIPLGLLTLNPSELLAIAVVPIGLLALLRGRARLGPLWRVAAPLAIGNAILIISSLYAGRLGLESLSYWARNASFAVVLLLAFRSLRTGKWAQRVVAALSWASLVPIAVGLFQAVTATGLREMVGDGVGRIYGTWSYPNAFGFYLLMLFPLAFLKLLDATDARQRMLAGVWSSLIVGCIFLTYARAAWAGLVVETVVISIARRNWRLLLALVALTGIVLLAVPSARLRLVQAGDVDWASPELGGNSVEWRLAAWQRALSEGSTAALIGHGANAVREVLGFDAHNDYLAILIESGGVGLLAYAWLQAALLAASVRSYRAARSLQHRHLALALIAILAAFSVMSLTDNIVSYFQLNVYLWLLVGIVCALPGVEGECGVLPAAGPPGGAGHGLAASGWGRP